MISSDAIRGYTDLMILNLLLTKDSYGYEISRDIRTRTSETYIIKETTLYSAFARLEKHAYITSFPGTETQGKKRTYYRLTTRGRDYYTQKCREWAEIKVVVDLFITE